MPERYYDELLHYLLRAVRDRDEAQDLTQQVFERVLALQHGGGQVDAMRALLYQAARNLLVDRYRQQLVRAHVGEEALQDLPGPPGAEPEAVYAAMQRVRRVALAIEALPPRCRQAFVRHKIDGLSHADVATEMQIGLNMVERHIMLAVALCRKALAEPAPVPATAQAQPQRG